jgi:hypothetical protein
VRAATDLDNAFAAIVHAQAMGFSSLRIRIRHHGSTGVHAALMIANPLSGNNRVEIVAAAAEFYPNHVRGA